MNAVLPVVLLAALGCGPTQKAPSKHAHDRPLSAQEHLEEAQRHSRVADAEQAAAASESERTEVRCNIDEMQEQSRIGAEPVRFIHPCFTSVTNPTADHLSEARANRIEARRHRNSAAALIETEARECAGLSEEAKTHSPFYHREDITALEPLVENGATIGVTVTFRKVRGLSRPWMERALACHRARAAVLGYPSDYMAPHGLSSVRGAEVSVRNRDGSIIVDVRGSDAASAATILGRALQLQRRAPIAQPKPAHGAQ